MDTAIFDVNERITIFNNAELVKENKLDKFLDRKYSERLITLESSRKEEQSVFDDLVSRLVGVNSELNVLESKKDRISPVERNWYNHVHKELTDKISGLETSKADQKAKLGRTDDTIEISKNYLTIDLNFLKMSREISFETESPRSTLELESWKVQAPTFAVFRYESDEPFRIAVKIDEKHCWYNKSIYGAKASIMKPKNFDNSKIMESMMNNYTAYNRSDNCIGCHFTLETCNYGINKISILARNELSGFIPDKTKDLVAAAKHYFGDDIYIISEAKEWIMEKVEVIPAPTGCPLVIGIKHGEAYFIDAFNCTPKENYVKDTYVEGKAGQN